MEFLRSDGHKVVPWKNGGGVTREIAVRSESGAGYDFLWRVSIATVRENGPFSRFKGIDRTIAMMAGGGIVLRGDVGEVALGMESEPYAFSGESDIDAVVSCGETTDLNAMTRRNRFRHSMERLKFSRAFALDGQSDETVIVFNSRATAEFQDRRFLAQQFDAIAGIRELDRVHLIPEGESEVFVIRMTEVAQV